LRPITINHLRPTTLQVGWRQRGGQGLRRLLKNPEGAPAIEYTLIGSLIAVAAIVAMGSVGTKVNGVLSNVASTM
jgi:pilus assembly protein Flp/PilA